MENAQVLKEINDRITALGEQVSDQRLKKVVEDYFAGLGDDHPVVRKMRFGSETTNPLYGSKFSRWGLTVSDVEWLYDVMNSARVYGKRGPSTELDNAFKHISDAIYMTEDEVRRIDRAAIDDLYPRVHKGNRAQYEAAVRAMDTAESGYGSQLVGAQYVGEMWQAARRASRVFSLLNTFEMTAPTSYLPVEAALPEMLYVSQSTANNASNYSTSKTGTNSVTVSAAKFVIHQMWSGEMEEDSIVPFVPMLRAQAEKALAHYSDSVVVNGDTTNAATLNINLTDADPADTKAYLAFDGIRHVALIDNTGNETSQSGAAPTLDAILGLRTLMIDRTYDQDWGHPEDPNDLVYVCDPETGDAIDKIDDFRSVDKFGPSAVVLAGQVGKIGQSPLIGSIAVKLSNTSGLVSTTAGNNLYGQVVAFNKRAFVVGWRRRVKVEFERIPATDQTRLVYSLRMGLGRYSPTGAAAGLECAAVLYYVAV